MFKLRLKNIIDSHLSKKEQELMLLLLSNIRNDENLLKIDIQKIPNNTSFFPFVSKYSDSDISSNFILISNDIILIPTKHIYKKEAIPNSLTFPQIDENILFSTNNLIVENNNYNCNYSVIKVLNKHFLFKNYLKIPNNSFDAIDIKNREKFFVNINNKEESLGTNIPYNTIKNYHQDSPIYIKKANQLYLIGVIKDKKEPYFFRKNELFDIKKKMENIELQLQFYQIKKLDLSNQAISDEEMQFIFKYDFINLEYLNLENNKLTSNGIEALQNISLRNIKFLNLSKNPIKDEGLTYLKYLSNLEQLIINDMDELSDDYFCSLQSNSFIDKIKHVTCNKKKLTLKYVNSNYNKFTFPNLNCLKIASSNIDIKKFLKYSFLLDNIWSKIIYLDLSNIGLTDKDILILTENVSILKNIKRINLENNNLTEESKKYFSELEINKIEIIFKLGTRKENYNILLGGSTISGKTSYYRRCCYGYFINEAISTIGAEKHSIKDLNYDNVHFYLIDCSHWGGKYDGIIKNQIKIADGVILLFDISRKEDFNGLPKLLEMITCSFDLEDFPVLLVGNKSDLEHNVSEEEIEEFLKKNNFIGYFEVSSKENINVKESVRFMVDYIYEKEKK